MIKNILWDIDGTLLNFEKSEKYALKKCFEVFSIGECTDEMVSRYSEINRGLWEELERGMVTKKFVLIKRFERFFESEGISFSKTGEFNEEYQLRLGDKFFFCDNALETVTLLKGKARQYAVTNGTYKAQSRKLTGSGLINLFDGVFISDSVGFEKPSPQFFEAVKNEIGGFGERDTMIVGDSLTSDMKGGNNAGIICCWYNPGGRNNDTAAVIDYDISDLKEVGRIACEL